MGRTRMRVTAAILAVSLATALLTGRPAPSVGETPVKLGPHDRGDDASAPGGTDAAVTPPAVDALPLSAETVDLLIVRAHPDRLTDSDYRRMMIARWEYEASIPSDQDEPLWGRFFALGTPKPTEEEPVGALADFKAWTIKRATALPDRLRLQHRIFLRESGPVNVTTPGSPISGDPRTTGAEDWNCRTDARTTPALAPACDYLVKVRETTPHQYPFGFGHEPAGPRVTCATALPSYKDPYCTALVAQFAKSSLVAIEPGFRDIFVYDKEIYFSADPEQMAALKGKVTDLAVDVEVTGVRIQDRPLPRPFDEALKRYDAYRQKLGLKPSAARKPKEPPSLPYFIFDATVRSARLVMHGKAEEVVANLEVRPARTLDLDTLGLPDTKVQSPEAPYGPDVGGVQLGMSFKQAERRIRASMKVGHVLTRDRAQDISAVSGEFKEFTSSRLYVAADNSEFIVLYDEPPSAPNIVLGITRYVSFKKGEVTPLQALGQLRKKYGQEAVTGRNGKVGWGEALLADDNSGPVALTRLPSSNNTRSIDWREADGTPTAWQPEGGTVPNLTMHVGPWSQAMSGPILAADLATDRGRLILQLTDPALYARHYAESKRLVKLGEATFAGETVGEDILGLNRSSSGGSGGVLISALIVLGALGGLLFAWMRMPALRRSLLLQVRRLRRQTQRPHAKKAPPEHMGPPA